MSEYHLCETLEWKEAIPPGNKTSTITGSEVAAVTSLGYVTFYIQVGAVSQLDGTNYFTFKVQQATATGGTFSDVDSSQYVNAANSWDKILNASGDANTIFRITVEASAGYDYYKLIGTATASPDADISAGCVWHPRSMPTT